jgi:hypothetical protein
VDVEFLGGADFATPPPEGTGRRRHDKLKTLEEAKAPMIRKWIEQASRVRGWKWRPVAHVIRDKLDSLRLIR